MKLSFLFFKIPKSTKKKQVIPDPLFLFPHIFYSIELFRITYCTCFTDYRDLNLSRISHFILNLLSNFI